MDAIAVREGRSADVPRALTVTELTRLLKDTLRSNPLLTRVLIRGEAIDVQPTPAGHWFFALRDANAQVACVLFREEREGLGFDLEDGMEVVASGDVDLYARRGEVQLVVRALTPAGVGAFWASFQHTRKKLAAEGLFDAARKRRLPRFPRRIGLVTSEAGAVVHDIVTILRRRFPLAEVVVAPALVQGPEAAASLRRALSEASAVVDVVILARGGGSLEDLWCFNDEPLARAVAACPVPVVSAVGHETDVTIVDFVADVRAPTPSAAAEVVSPDVRVVSAQVDESCDTLRLGIRDALRERWTEMERLRERLTPKGLRRAVEMHAARLRSEAASMLRASATGLVRRRDRLDAVGRRLDVLSPLATMRRGYAIVARPDGRVLPEAAPVEPGDPLIVRMQDARLHIHVDAKEVS